MCTVPNIDYDFVVPTPPPPGYPTQATPDPYTTRPLSGDYATRRRALLAHISRNPAPADRAAPYYELARLAAGGEAHAGVFQASLDYIAQRKDCADFVSHGILRLLYQFGDDPRLDRALLERARQTVLDFKYWPDEPGVDSMCTWTENHHVLFAAGAYLAGQLYPQDIFRNSGQSGHQKMAAHRPRIMRWLRLSFGRLRVCYHSLSQGRLEFGWRGPLCQNGALVPLGDYPRYDNPYVQASFPANEIVLRHGAHELRLNWQEAARQASAFV
jgi:hypothetical protein